MEKTLLSTAYAAYTLREDGSVLKLRWTAATAGMTEDAFRAEMLTFAELAIEHQPVVLLVDTIEFAHQMSDATGQWRSEEIIPRYNRAGIKKLGFLLPPTAGDAGAPVREAGATFETGWFTTGQPLEDWITSPT